jgi:hypothetical protein
LPLFSWGLAHPALRRVRSDLLLANLAPPALLELTAATSLREGSPRCPASSKTKPGWSKARYRAASFILKAESYAMGTTLILVHGNMKPARD